MVEVVVAILLIAMMTGPMMSVALTSRMSVGRTDRRMAASICAKRVSEALKAYVTADRSLAFGPGMGADGWSLPGDQAGGYALGAGLHDLDSALWLQPLASYQGRISYT